VCRTEATRRGQLTRSSRASTWVQVNAVTRTCGWSVRDIESVTVARADNDDDDDDDDDDGAFEEHVGTLNASRATPIRLQRAALS